MFFRPRLLLFDTAHRVVKTVSLFIIQQLKSRSVVNIRVKRYMFFFSVVEYFVSSSEVNDISVPI